MNGERAQRLVTPQEVADWLGVSLEKLGQMRYQGDGPVFVKVGKAVRYESTDVQAWIDSQRFTRTGEVA